MENLEKFAELLDLIEVVEDPEIIAEIQKAIAENPNFKTVETVSAPIAAPVDLKVFNAIREVVLMVRGGNTLDQINAQLKKSNSVIQPKHLPAIIHAIQNGKTKLQIEKDFKF